MMGIVFFIISSAMVMICVGHADTGQVSKNFQRYGKGCNFHCHQTVTGTSNSLAITREIKKYVAEMQHNILLELKHSQCYSGHQGHHGHQGNHGHQGHSGHHGRKVASCKDILDRTSKHSLKDGVYDIIHEGKKMKVYCDMTRNGGGWTLITAVRTNNGWTPTTVYARDVGNPSLYRDYSILGKADDIKNHAKGKTFEYRIEANGRGQWGGIWQAPVSYTFTSTNKLQTNVALTTKFGPWQYSSSHGIEKRMPWINLKHGSALLTTDGGGSWWGTLMMRSTVATSTKKAFNLGPWINPQVYKLKKLFYWLREN